MVVVAFLAGVAAAVLLWRLLAPAFASEVFTRQNFRGRDLPTAAGVVIALVVVLGDGLVALVEAADRDVDAALQVGLRATTLVALGFALLGLLDDLGGVGQSGGFRQHLTELARGRLTTGATKLFGGAAVGVIAASARPDQSLGRLLADGALIALAANLGNLFDRAPGRAVKVAGLVGVVLVVATWFDPVLAGAALTVGAGVGLAWPDLRERLMLGDAGANVLGAALGLGVVLACSPLVRSVVLAVVAALNLASERVSFSRVIDRVAPLRVLDHLGRQE